MNMPPIVSPQEWEAAREELLVKEKELTRARDALAAERRRMPRMAVEKDYRFEGPDGPASLLDLFEGRRQLIVYRFFFEPGVAGWPESGCRGCSFMADQVAHLAHLNARDTTLAFVSRAPQADIERWKARMGWDDPLVHDHRRLRRRLRRRRVARHQRLPPRRRPDLPHLLHQQPRRRGDGQHLELPRHHRARPPGGVGGLARGLPADAAVPVVEPATTSTTSRPSRGALSSARRSQAGSRARDRSPRRRRAGRGDPAVAGRRRRRLLVARAWVMVRLRRRREPEMTDKHDAAHRAHLPGARPGGVRRVDQRGGDAPLVARRARLGDDRGRGRPARRRRRARRHARPAQGRRVRRRRPLHGDRPADPPGVHLALGRRRPRGR